MKFISTRIITADVNRLVNFYEMVTEVSAVWGNELFAEIPTPIGTLAIGSDKTVPLFGDGSAEPAANRSAIVEFIVADVDAEYARLRDRVAEVVTKPTTMPWENRALLFRDPDGNLVNLFTPVTDEARAKFGVDYRRGVGRRRSGVRSRGNNKTREAGSRPGGRCLMASLRDDYHRRGDTSQGGGT